MVRQWMCTGCSRCSPFACENFCLVISVIHPIAFIEGVGVMWRTKELEQEYIILPVDTGLDLHHLLKKCDCSIV